MSRIVNTYVPVWHHAGWDMPRTFPMFVMTQDAQGLYACYAGLATLPDPESKEYGDVRLACAEEIKVYGQKMTYQMTTGFFSGISEEQYRA